MKLVLVSVLLGLTLLSLGGKTEEVEAQVEKSITGLWNLVIQREVREARNNKKRGRKGKGRKGRTGRKGSKGRKGRKGSKGRKGMRSGNKKSRKGGRKGGGKGGRKGRRKGKTGKKSGQRKAAGRQSVQVIGVDCEYVVLEDLINNPSCTKGTKFVLKKGAGNRKQFLIMEMGGKMKTVIAMVPNGKDKFPVSCNTRALDATSKVKCKAVPGLDSMALVSGSATAGTSAPGPATSAPASGGAVCATGEAECKDCGSFGEIGGIKYCCKAEGKCTGTINVNEINGVVDCKCT